ncbi:MAG: UvrD-helicase domain-containing protein [Acidimicrobiia bacterium]
MSAADLDARHDIASSLGENLFVEAGAGTGKTHELVGRVVGLVARGTDIRRLAVITFTEAAAAELRERVREQLAREAIASADAERRTRCEAALAAIDDAAIGTLHGFAQRTLAEFPVEAGLPPGFEVLDEIESDVAFTERWARFLDRLFADDATATAIATVTVLEIGLRPFEGIARTLGSSWDLAREWAPAPEPVPTFDPAPVLERMRAATALASKCGIEGDTLLTFLREVEARAHQVEAALDELEALELLMPKKLTSGNRGKKDSWHGAKDEVVACLNEAEHARIAAIDRVRGPAVRTLLGAVAQHVRDSVEERRRDGRIDFHDLLVMSVELLRSSPVARARLHERYEHLLLDEFQDTDPLQIELAVLIASPDADSGSKPWSDCSVVPGRIFVVGDPKQSIYRFRRADIELYRLVGEVLGDREGTRRALTTSFRARPGIVAFVNEVFEPLMSDDTPLQALYHPLIPDRDPCAATPEPVRTFGTAAPKGTDLDQLRRTEARELAAIVRRVRDERWQVRDRAVDGGTRDAHFADIAILLPTRATLSYLEEALDEADVPTRIESQSLVFATAEVEELLHVLQAADDPVDEVAIVAALRSPGFACTDTELVEFARAGGSWDYRVSPPPALPPDHAVVDGLGALLALHERRWWDGVSELVERVIRERRLLELAVERRRPRDHWRRLRFVADAARAYADRGGTSLRGFVQWAQRQADEEARAVEVIVPEPDDDAVRVLTVHGAKGLEFPVVLLTGLGLIEQARPGVVLFGDDGPEMQVGRQAVAYVSPGFEALKQREVEAWRAEQIRLLYVALTRAEDHLVISMHRREGDTCLGNHLAVAASSRPELTGSAAGRVTRDSAQDDEHDVVRTDRASWIAARHEQIATNRRAPVVAATTLARVAADAREPGLEKGETDATETPPWRRGRAGTALGRAVHAVLQTVDLATGDGLDATARAQALAEAIPGRESEIRALVESVLASSTVRTATVAGARCWREVPVAAPVAGTLVEGFIDLLIEDADGFTVVDYKTDRAPSEEALDTALARYSPQGAAYALALEAVLGRPVNRCVFVFARSGGAVEREVPDLRSAVAAVRAQVLGPQPEAAI